jgi:UDP-N-acetylglucosamine 3-dehydrogenase
MKMEKRIGVIGLGMMGHNHVRVAQEVDGVKLVGVADPVGDRFSVAGGVPVFSTPEELIEHGIDMAIVAAPTGDHERLGLILAEAGVHALIEKPLASTLAGARALTEAFAENRLVGCVGHIERYNPSLQQLKARLRDGQIGEIIQIATRRIGPFPARIQDVGVVKDLATHDLDLTAWLADSPYATVTAQCAHKTGREHEDLVAITGRLENGIVVNHLVNWLSPVKERITMVTGTMGAFAADTLSGDLTFYANADVPPEWSQVSGLRGVAEGDQVRYAYPKREPLRVEHEAFRDAVLGVGSDIVTMEQGMRVVELAELVLASAQE